MSASLLGLLSTLVGFISSVLPSLVSYWSTKQRYQYEIEITKLRIQALREGVDPTKLAADIAALVAEGKSIRLHDSYITSNEYINILRASVRPLLTYLFFFLFIGIKAAAATLLFQQGYDAIKVLEVIWDDYTVSIFGAIVGFWFGTRSMIYFAEAQEKGIAKSIIVPEEKK